MPVRSPFFVCAVVVALGLYWSSASEVLGQNPTGGGFSEPDAASAEEIAVELPHGPRPCPPSVDFCRPERVDCDECQDGPPRLGNGYLWSHLNGRVFRLYAGSYEMRTKQPYPRWYHGNYYFRPWLPGYVRQEREDFEPGHYERPFYHHVDYYPHDSLPHAHGAPNGLDDGATRPIEAPDLVVPGED